MKNRQSVVKSVAGIVVFAAVAIGAGVLGAQTVGASARANAPSVGSIIAVIDLELIINSLTERNDMQESLKVQAQRLDDKIGSLTADGKARKEELDKITDPVAKGIARKSLEELMFRGEFERQFGVKRLTDFEAESLKTLYDKIDAVAERIAKKNGYDLVLVSDEKPEIPATDIPTMKRNMLLKRMLFVNPALDITQEVITTMNNEYATGAKK